MGRLKEELSFRLSESDFKYLGGTPDGEPLTINKTMLKDVLCLQYPVEILTVQYKKITRGKWKGEVSYLVTVGLYRSDMDDLRDTLRHAPCNYGRGLSEEEKYDLLVCDLLWCYSETLGPPNQGIATPNELILKPRESRVYKANGLYRGPDAYVWEPKEN